MIKKITETLTLLCIAVVVPLAGRLDLLKTWPVGLIIGFGILLTMSQPSMAATKTIPNTHDRYSMLLITVGAILCYAIPLCDFAYRNPEREILIHQSSTILGIIFIYGGFAFRYWSIQVLGKFFSSKVEIKEGHELIQIGPYKILRHPSYSGAWISMVGVSLLFQSKIGLVFSIFIYFLIYIYRIECEEKALVGTFGEKYTAYQEKTWRMFPYLY